MQDYQIIQHLLLTEKGTAQTESQNKYFFQVHPSANKQQIKSAVERLFDVTVTNVNTMNRKGKKKRERTVNFGKAADWKRAVVTLSAGQSIEMT